MFKDPWGEIILVLSMIMLGVIGGYFGALGDAEKSCNGDHRLEILGNQYTCVPNPRYHDDG